MNFPLPHLPERTRAPRTHGLTMVMDKGLSLRQAEDLIAVADDRVDFLKLGFGTSLFTPDHLAVINRDEPNHAIELTLLDDDSPMLTPTPTQTPAPLPPARDEATHGDAPMPTSNGLPMPSTAVPRQRR